MLKKIYFDMDGVLADFNRGVRELCHFEPVDQNSKESSEEKDNEMWSKVREVEHFYDKLEPMPGAIEMFNEIRKKNGNICEILTGIPRPRRGIADAAEDKKKWIRRYLGEDIVVNIVYRAEKINFCQGKEYVLIDDLKKNIKEWEAAGGTGILYTSAGEIHINSGWDVQKDE